MNSAPACIILEQLGVHGAEPGGDRGGGRVEKAATLPVLEQICCGGRGVAGLGEEKLQLLSPKSYGRMFCFFLASSRSFRTSHKIGRDLSPNISESMRKSIWSDAFCSMEFPSLQAQTYLSLSPLRFNVRKSGIRVQLCYHHRFLKFHSIKQPLVGTTLKSFGWKKAWRHCCEQSPAGRQL